MNINESFKNKQILIATINSVAVLSLLSVVGTTALLYDRPTESSVEKRVLAEFPKFSVSSFFEGTFTTELSMFFADTFPSREKLINLSYTVAELSGVRMDDIRIHEVNTEEEIFIPPPVTLTPSDSSVRMNDKETGKYQSSLEKEDDENAAAVRIGAIYVYKGQGMQIFGGSDEMAAWYADTLNSYSDNVGEDVQIYNLVIPSVIEFALPEKYQSVTTPELAKIENIYNQLNDEIKSVNAYDILNEHKDEYLYFNTDHHWTSLGAYYAYVEFCKEAGLDPIDINTLEKRTLEGFLGSHYTETKDNSMLKKIDYVDYYMMPTEYDAYQYAKNSPSNPTKLYSIYGEYANPEDSYSLFLHGDSPLTRIDTEIKNGRKIVLVKESYGNAFAPFLINHFEQVFVVDERHFQTSLLELIEENEVTDVLFINNIFAAHTSSHINNIGKIMNQTYVPPVINEPVEESVEDIPATDLEMDVVGDLDDEGEIVTEEETTDGTLVDQYTQSDEETVD